MLYIVPKTLTSRTWSCGFTVSVDTIDPAAVMLVFIPALAARNVISGNHEKAGRKR